MFEAIFSEAGIVFIAGTTLFLIIMLLMIGMLIKLVFSIFRGKQRRARQADAATINIDRVHQVLEGIGNRANRHGEQSRPEPAYHDPSPSSVLHEASSSFGRRNNAADARADPFRIAAGRTKVPDTVQETISVILRRQVPIRDDEPPRSWLGGLPMLPENVSWPKSTSRDYPGRDPMPLHFLAQICCADLPEEVWGGLGPRVGWLLFFIDPNTCEPTEDEGSKVLHTLEPGVERQPPADIGPVYDGVYAGPSYDYVEDVGEVPKSWRRWPVELVTVANKVNDVDGLLTVAPANFASELYRGQEVFDDRFQPVNPFTSTMAIAALSHIARLLKRQTIGPELPDSVLQGLNDPDAFISLIPDLRALKQRAEDRRREAEAIEDTQSDEAQKISHRLSKTEKYLDSQTRLSALLELYPSGTALEDYRRDIIHANTRWRAEALQKLQDMLDGYLAQDPDTQLPVGEWDGVEAWLKRTRTSYFDFTFRGEAKDIPRRFAGHEREVSLLSLYDAKAIGLHEFVSDYYVDPHRRSLIPAAVLAQFEPWWRQLYDNRPHRVGGEFDALQSTPRIGPTGSLTLLHLASDNAMNWAWGDSGIVYFEITTKNLAEGRFDKAIAILECH